MLLAALAAAVALVAGMLVSAAGNGGGVSPVGRKGVSYTLVRFNEHRHALAYVISGNATTALHPGTSSTIDLRFQNPNSQRITIPSGAITVTIGAPGRGCPAHRNFEVVHTLTASITVPANATRTLSALGVPPAEWPVVEMKDTAATQDACAGATLPLRYSANHGHRGKRSRHAHGAPTRGAERTSTPAGAHGRPHGS